MRAVSSAHHFAGPDDIVNRDVKMFDSLTSASPHVHSDGNGYHRGLNFIYRGLPQACRQNR
jgi:hypothetical protein